MNNNMEKKKFIDLNGLKLIWGKLDNSLTEVNEKILELTTEVATLKERVDSIGTTPSEPPITESHQ